MSAEILRFRAKRLAERESFSAPTQVDVITALTFRLNGERFGLRVGAVANVIPLARLTPVPVAAAAMLGVMAVKGEVYTIFDLARLIGLPSSDALTGTDAYVLIMKHGDARVGVAVGQVDQIVTAGWAGHSGEAESRRLIRVGDHDLILIEDIEHLLAPHIHGDGQ